MTETELKQGEDQDNFKGFSSIDLGPSEQLSNLNKVHTAEALKVELEASQGV